MHPDDANQAAFLHELKALQAESIGWLPLEQGAYLHVGNPDEQVITVVGVPDASMAGMNGKIGVRSQYCSFR